MKNIKVGKSIVKHLDKLKEADSIVSFSAVDDSIDGMYESVEINVKVNDVFDIRVYNETSSITGKTTSWIIEYGEDGHMMYYGSERTQKALLDTLCERVNYGNVLHLRRYEDKYSNVNESTLRTIVATRDIQIKKLMDKLNVYESFIEDKIGGGKNA